MPELIVDLGATVTCAHGGRGIPAAGPGRVRITGQPVITSTTSYVVADCPVDREHAVRNDP